MQADETPLPTLYLALTRARNKVAEQRGTPSQPSAGLAARAELLDALERYVTALETSRRPVPYALRDELRLRRGLTRSPYGT